jgi:hypothetical protein
MGTGTTIQVFLQHSNLSSLEKIEITAFITQMDVMRNAMFCRKRDM